MSQSKYTSNLQAFIKNNQYEFFTGKVSKVIQNCQIDPSTWKGPINDKDN